MATLNASTRAALCAPRFITVRASVWECVHFARASITQARFWRAPGMESFRSTESALRKATSRFAGASLGCDLSGIVSRKRPLPSMMVRHCKQIGLRAARDSSSAMSHIRPLQIESNKINHFLSVHKTDELHTDLPTRAISAKMGMVLLRRSPALLL